MNIGILFHRACYELWKLRKHFKTRRFYCLLSVINYTNGLLFATLMFSDSPILNVLFCLASCLIGISITGIYLNAPCIMLPDILYKVILATCALFYSIIQADEGGPGTIQRLFLVVVAVLLQFYENYFLFNAIAAFHLEMEGLVQNRPPPQYELFSRNNRTTDIRPNAKNPESSVINCEEGACCSSSSGPAEGSSWPGASLAMSDPEQERSQTPPPSYYDALAMLQLQSKPKYLV